MAMDQDLAFLDSILAPSQIELEVGEESPYANDESPFGPYTPDAVVSPDDTAEVAVTISAANEAGVPVTPHGGGSSLEGNALPVEGGIVMDLLDLDSIEVRPADLQVNVGPGVVYDQLNAELSPHGFQFPPGISSGDVATIGGMIANNASGFNSTRYGETRDHVLRLQVVLANGEVIECGNRAPKTSSGYSLKDLFVGSEGTLGVVTEATLTVAGLSEHRQGAVAVFDSERAAASAVAESIGFGLDPAAIEYLGGVAIELINEYHPMGLAPKPTLLLEFHANTSGITEDLAFAEEICLEAGAMEWREPDEGSMQELWDARRDAYFAFTTYRPAWDIARHGDVDVPISNYPDIVEFIHERSANYGITTPCVGHAGDGNLHYSPLVDTEDPEQMRSGLALYDEIVVQAIELDGTATGEHGVGIGKRDYMELEHGPALEIMRSLKRTLDPKGILNPGKVFPYDVASGS